MRQEKFQRRMTWLVDLFIPAMNDTSSMHNNSSDGEEQDKDNFH